MGKFSWTDESVEFMSRAEARSGYSAMLAEHIRPYLSGIGTVLEPGCGVGGLSLALAPFVGSLTAADIDPLPLNVLRKGLKARGITNVTVREQDVFALVPGVRYDAAVFCFFGMPEQILAFCAQHVKKDVFVIKRAYTRHRFSVKDIPITGDSLSGLCELLMARGIPYTEELLSAEMGQPFRDPEEARRFFALYGKADAGTALLEPELLSRLQRTDDPEYPYYLPARKEVGLVHFTAEDL